MRKSTPKFEGKLHVKKGDTVQILAGKDAGKTGVITKVYPKTGRVLVEQPAAGDGAATPLNAVTKHVKAQPTPGNPNPQGGIQVVAAPLQVSKIALVNAAGDATRIRVEVGADGKKARIAVKGGGSI